MTTLTFVKFTILTSLVFLGTYALYRENDLIKFERKLKKVVVAFSKAVYYTAIEKFKPVSENTKNEPEFIITDKDYDEMLSVISQKQKNNSEKADFIAA